MSIQLVFTDFLDLSFGLSATAVLPQLAVSTPSGDFILEKDVSVATLKSVFYFQTDDPITYDASFTRYFVDISGWSTIATDLNPMFYQITSSSNGAYGNNTTDNLGKHFLRYLAQSLFGTYLGVDLFENEDSVYADLSSNSYSGVYTQVLNKLKRVDKAFGAVSDLADIKSGANGYYLEDATGTYNITRSLVKQIASSVTAKARFEALESTYKISTGVYSVPFVAGDSIYYTVRVTPSSTQHQVVGLNQAIGAKTYILKLNVIP
jgi:hypothetical protein